MPSILAYGTQVSKDADLSVFGETGKTGKTGETLKVAADAYSPRQGRHRVEFSLALATVSSDESWIYVVETVVDLQSGKPACFLGDVGQMCLHLRNAYDEVLYRYSSEEYPVPGWVRLSVS